MTTEKLNNLREAVDWAIYEFVAGYGYNADDYDYSQFNELLDEIEQGDI